MSIIRIVKKFKLLLSSHQKLRIAELFVLMVIGGFFETFSVTIILPFVNAVVSPEETMQKPYIKVFCDVFKINSSRKLLIYLAIILALLYIIKNIYLLIEYDIQYRFVYNNMLNLQRRILENYLRRPYEYFIEAQSGEVIRTINTDTTGTFALLVVLLNMLTELIVSGMLIIAVFLITPLVTIVMASVLFVLLIVISRVVKPILSKAGNKRQDASAQMNKWLIQAVHGIKEVKVMNKENFFEEKYAYYAKRNIDSFRQSQILTITPRFLIEAISMGAFFLAVAIMIYSGIDLESIVPMLSAIAMAAIRLLPSVNRISIGINSIAYDEAMVDSVIEDLQEIGDEEPISFEMKLDYKKDNKKVKIPKLREEISFSDITYKYPMSESSVLEHASFKINRGESIGIIGASGAGKTTTVDIILGLLFPQRGSVRIDGVDVHSNVPDWINQIGYIPQVIFMLDGTIRENVAFGVSTDNIEENRIWEVLEEASLKEFVERLPKGLDTEIGERGMKISGGQRQRLGIARALYTNPEVLFFDEATSALDDETEKSIIESINHLHGKKTLVIIAHRTSTLIGCDHIYKVEEKSICMVR